MHKQVVRQLEPQSQISSTRYPSLLGRQRQYEMRICLILLHMISSGNRNPEILILSPKNYPLDHRLPGTWSRKCTHWFLQIMRWIKNRYNYQPPEALYNVDNNAWPGVLSNSLQIFQVFFPNIHNSYLLLWIHTITESHIIQQVVVPLCASYIEHPTTLCTAFIG